MVVNNLTKNIVSFAEQIAKTYNVTQHYVRAVIRDVEKEKYNSQKANDIRAAYKFHLSSMEIIKKAANQ